MFRIIFGILIYSQLCYGMLDIKDFFIDIEPILDQLDDVIASNSNPSSELLELCSKALLAGSFILPDKWKILFGDNEYKALTAKFKLYRLESEEIVQKLKQLPSKPEEGFIRDMFQVRSDERNADYLVVAREYYSEVQFYETSTDMMKLCEWKVYQLTSSVDSAVAYEDMQNRKDVAHYNLEKSQSKDGTPTYMFGRTNLEDGGHVSLVNYGTHPGPQIDGYYQMKLLVIQDLESSKGLPVLARTIRNKETGINTLISYGFNRRIQDLLGIEVDDDTLYDDDIVKMFDTKTGRKITKTDL